MPATSPRSSLWALFATLIASALYSGVAAYNPGFSVSLGNPGDETLVAHDIHPVTFMSAVLSSSASSAAPCLPFRARAGGAAACVGTDLVVSMVTRNGGVARTFRIGTPDEDIGLGIAWSPLNNLLYIMGRSKGTGQHWVAVVDSSGAKKNQIMIGTADGATSTKLLITNFQIDRMGNVFFAGTTTSAFGPNGCRIRPDTRKDIDVVVCKLGGALVYRWCKAIGGGYADRPAVVGGTGIAFDAHGNTFIAGTTSGALPGKRSLGGMDAFVAKLDANGNVNWTSQIGSGGADTAVAISVDTYSDMIYVSGNTNGLIDQKRGGMDWFTFQLRSINGSTVWKRQYGGPGDDLMTDMVVYHQRVFYVGTLPVASGDWTPYWKDNGNATHYHNAINSGVRTWYNGYLRGGRDVVVCELAQVGDEAKPSRDWTFVPVGMLKWCSAYGSMADEGTASLRIYGYNMSFPWISSGDFETNQEYNLPNRGLRDVGYSMYWEYDLPMWPNPKAPAELATQDIPRPLAACQK